jgi:Protein of unknown function (DUF1367).
MSKAPETRSRIFVRRGNALVPGDVKAAEALAKMKEGTGYLVNIHRPRNLIHHRKLFALLNLVQENTDRWPTVETLLDDLKVATGLFETRINAVSGLPYVVAKSISFASMTQDEFEDWFDKAVDIVCRQVLDMDRGELMAEIEDILMGRRAA